MCHGKLFASYLNSTKSKIIFFLFCTTSFLQIESHARCQLAVQASSGLVYPKTVNRTNQKHGVQPLAPIVFTLFFLNYIMLFPKSLRAENVRKPKRFDSNAWQLCEDQLTAFQGTFDFDSHCGFPYLVRHCRADSLETVNHAFFFPKDVIWQIRIRTEISYLCLVPFRACKLESPCSFVIPRYFISLNVQVWNTIARAWSRNGYHVDTSNNLEICVNPSEKVRMTFCRSEKMMCIADLSMLTHSKIKWRKQISTPRTILT